MDVTRLLRLRLGRGPSSLPMRAMHLRYWWTRLAPGVSANVWEWCNDWHSETYYSTTPCPHVNPRGPTTGIYRVLRGGSWFEGAPSGCRVANRSVSAHQNHY